MKRKIVIGSRGSDLALWQANHVKSRLEAIGLKSEIKIIKTQGDSFFNLSFSKLEGKGFFTKELEEELLGGTIDLAVHSHKDLPTESPEGLRIAAVSEREDPTELLLIHKDFVDVVRPLSVRYNGIVGTSSARRRVQFKSLRPDVDFEELRGNVPTRIQKLRDGEYHAIILAKAGVARLGLDLSDFHVEEIDPVEMIPAPAQGVLALQIREKDTELFDVLQQINDKNVAETIGIERKVLNLFDGGCHMPLGVFCKKEGPHFQVWTSMAEDEDDFPSRLFIETDSIEGLPERILEHYKKKKNTIKSLFISRELSEDSYFARALKKFNLDIEDRSLIRTFPIINAFDSYILKKVDWIFFNSKNGVENFFRMEPVIPKKIKFGVMGRGSEQELRQHGRIPDFVGDSGDIREVAEHLLPFVKGKSVLFPQAKESLRTIQNQLGEQIVSTDLPVYETIHTSDIGQSSADIMIFTSPSNVEAYLQNNNVIFMNQKVIAIGKSTGNKLEEFGYTNYVIPYSPDEIGLAEAVFGLL
ncbi:hydroxymethylbilane synthase [Solitalea koreensis]|uniref:Hydroxymethylbilane synthase n=1 Tax=Solitalea koreensis TaxID=543615 RepID=A0A521ABW5_9SPHI|nr:hydroxymethylbilane synthase [Solitalea koreensis]SMO32304.1 hydroxymethylbilane synthase [Solitalea koreensis]